jgi:DNA (cytosine-5)-methyltransferase 1
MRAKSSARIPPARKAKRTLTAIDLFSGCGGLSVGLEKAGFRVRAAVENNRKAQATYELNHPDVKLYGDIRLLRAKRLMKELSLKSGALDLLAGCPPCQGFSRLRTRNKGKSVKDPRNDLIREFLRFVRVLRPKAVMLENVPSLREDKRFVHLVEVLEQLGYASEVKVLNAGDYSVPQRRKRLIMLASRVHEPKMGRKRSKLITVGQALAGICHPSKSTDAVHAMAERRTSRVKVLIRLIPKNGGSRSDLPVEHRLDCHKRVDGFHDVYGRMSWNSLAPTITSGCHNPSKGRFLHPRHNRTISLREAAILQGFPRRYKFDVSHGKEAIALMIGNALPPPFIAAHAKPLATGILGARER